MSDAELWSTWRMWMLIAAVIVVVAAALLVAIWVTARRILAEAQRALAAAEVVQRNTQAIWELQHTNEVGEQVLDTAEAIEAKGGALARALHEQGVRQR